MKKLLLIIAVTILSCNKKETSDPLQVAPVGELIAGREYYTEKGVTDSGRTPDVHGPPNGCNASLDGN